MKQIWVAVGNPLRGDDAVAHHAVDRAAGDGVRVNHQMQLTPELAAELAGFDRAIFVDAAVSGGVTVREITGDGGMFAWTHQVTPEWIVRLARDLFGFRGVAFVCAIEGGAFEPGCGLSARAQRNLNAAVEKLAGFVS